MAEAGTITVKLSLDAEEFDTAIDAAIERAQRKAAEVLVRGVNLSSCIVRVAELPDTASSRLI